MKKSIDIVERIPIVQLSISCWWVIRKRRSGWIWNIGLGACVCSWLVSLVVLVSWRWLLLAVGIGWSLLRNIGVIGVLCIGILLVLVSTLIGLSGWTVRYLLSMIALRVCMSCCLVGFATRWILIIVLWISIIGSCIRCWIWTIWWIVREIVGRIAGITAIFISSVSNIRVWCRVGEVTVRRWAIAGGCGCITSCIRCLIMCGILRRYISCFTTGRWRRLYCAEDSLILFEVILVVRVAYYRALSYDDARSYYQEKIK